MSWARTKFNYTKTGRKDSQISRNPEFGVLLLSAKFFVLIRLLWWFYFSRLFAINIIASLYDEINIFLSRCYFVNFNFINKKYIILTSYVYIYSKRNNLCISICNNIL